MDLAKFQLAVLAEQALTRTRRTDCGLATTGVAPGQSSALGPLSKMGIPPRERIATRLLAIACAIQVATVVAWAPAARAQATNVIDIVTEARRRAGQLPPRHGQPLRARLRRVEPQRL